MADDLGDLDALAAAVGFAEIISAHDNIEPPGGGVLNAMSRWQDPLRGDEGGSAELTFGWRLAAFHQCGHPWIGSVGGAGAADVAGLVLQNAVAALGRSGRRPEKCRGGEGEEESGGSAGRQNWIHGGVWLQDFVRDGQRIADCPSRLHDAGPVLPNCDAALFFDGSMEIHD